VCNLLWLTFSGNAAVNSYSNHSCGSVAFSCKIAEEWSETCENVLHFGFLCNFVPCFWLILATSHGPIETQLFGISLPSDMVDVGLYVYYLALMPAFLSLLSSPTFSMFIHDITLYMLIDGCLYEGVSGCKKG